MLPLTPPAGSNLKPKCLRPSTCHVSHVPRLGFSTCPCSYDESLGSKDCNFLLGLRICTKCSWSVCFPLLTVLGHMSRGSCYPLSSPKPRCNWILFRRGRPSCWQAFGTTSLPYYSCDKSFGPWPGEIARPFPCIATSAFRTFNHTAVGRLSRAANRNIYIQISSISPLDTT